jgi:hypothetical protein
LNKPVTLPLLPKATLRLRFDVDQHTDQLQADVYRDSSNTPNPNPEEGAFAGTLSLFQGEQVNVRIIGTGSRDGGFKTFQVIDCAIIARAGIVERSADGDTRFAPPSPFTQAIGASYVLERNFSGFVNPLNTVEREIVQDWKGSLDVGLSSGFWKLSFALTVRIIRGAGAVDEVRVFWQDPEAEVGGPGTLKEGRP